MGFFRADRHPPPTLGYDNLIARLNYFPDHFVDEAVPLELRRIDMVNAESDRVFKHCHGIGLIGGAMPKLHRAITDASY